MPIQQIRRATCVLLVTWLALSPSVALAKKRKGENTPPAGGTVWGTVRDSAGRALGAGFTIRLHHLRTGDTATAEIDPASGEYVLTGLPFGYFDIEVLDADGRFFGEKAVNVPPSSKIVVNLTVIRFDERSEEWKLARQRAGAEAEASGVAELAIKRRGRDFWKSNKGVVIIAGLGTGVLLAIAAGGGDEAVASPVTP